MKNNFGGWAIDKECFDKICEILPKGSTILELGSGSGTAELSKHYNVYSIEHDKNWLNLYKSIYIYAPLKPVKHNLNLNWYDIEIVKKEIPNKFDLLLVDGPPGNSSPNGMGRMGLYYYIDEFKLDDVIIVFDDLHRKSDFDNMVLITKKLGRSYKIFDSGKEAKKSKKFAVVYEKNK